MALTYDALLKELSNIATERDQLQAQLAAEPDLSKIGGYKRRMQKQRKSEIADKLNKLAQDEKEVKQKLSVTKKPAPKKTAAKRPAPKKKPAVKKNIFARTSWKCKRLAGKKFPLFPNDYKM